MALMGTRQCLTEKNMVSLPAENLTCHIGVLPKLSSQEFNLENVGQEIFKKRKERK